MTNPLPQLPEQTPVAVIIPLTITNTLCDKVNRCAPVCYKPLHFPFLWVGSSPLQLLPSYQILKYFGQKWHQNLHWVVRVSSLEKTTKSWKKCLKRNPALAFPYTLAVIRWHISLCVHVSKFQPSNRSDFYRKDQFITKKCLSCKFSQYYDLRLVSFVNFRVISSEMPCLYLIFLPQLIIHFLSTSQN